MTPIIPYTVIPPQVTLLTFVKGILLPAILPALLYMVFTALFAVSLFYTIQMDGTSETFYQKMIIATYLVATFVGYSVPQSRRLAKFCEYCVCVVTEIDTITSLVYYRKR